MTIASLASQFSDVYTGSRISLIRQIGETRIGQTIYFVADLKNTELVDAYWLVQPGFRVPLPEFIPGSSRQSVRPVKRLDVVGSPSPFGSSISVMLAEAWRFFVPAGSERSYAWFVPSEGLGFAGFTITTVDSEGNALPGIGIRGPVWFAVGSPHALMTEKVEQDLEAVS